MVESINQLFEGYKTDTPYTEVTPEKIYLKEDLEKEKSVLDKFEFWNRNKTPKSKIEVTVSCDYCNSGCGGCAGGGDGDGGGCSGCNSCSGCE